MAVLNSEKLKETEHFEFRKDEGTNILNEPYVNFRVREKYESDLMDCGIVIDFEIVHKDFDSDLVQGIRLKTGIASTPIESVTKYKEALNEGIIMMAIVKEWFNDHPEYKTEGGFTTNA